MRSLLAAVVVSFVLPAVAGAQTTLSKRTARRAAESFIRKHVESLETPSRWEVIPAGLCTRVSASRVNCAFIIYTAEEETDEAELWCPGVERIHAVGKGVYGTIVWDEHPSCLPGPRPRTHWSLS
jgi:hypothetical protein